MTFVVRTTGDPALLGPAAVRVINQIDPLLPVAAVRPLDDVFAESIARPRLTAVAMSIFAGAALLLAALGVYGIVAYSVSQRSREFGIRVALGARQGQIIGMVVGQNLRLVGLGLGLGLLAAIPATRLLRGLAVPGGTERSDDVCRHRSDPRDRRGRRVVSSRAPRHAGRSGGDVQGGIVRSRA